MSISLTNEIGFVAAAFTTLSFIPQLIKIWRQGGRDLSYQMLTMYLVGVGLWLIYGIRIQASAVIVANGVSVILVAAAIVMKAVVPPERGRSDRIREEQRALG